MISKIFGTNLQHDLIRGSILALLIAWPSYFLSGTVIKQNVHLSEKFGNAARAANKASNELIQKNNELEIARSKLVELANSDYLTGLANRRRFEQLLRESQNHDSEYGPTGILILFDLNGFKSVNDTHGHDAGDAILRHVGVRIRKCVSDLKGFGARLGGDEFGILIWDQMDEAEAMSFANSLREVLKQPHAYKGQLLTVTASIAVALHPSRFPSASDLYVTTDDALMMCKRTDKDNVVMVDSSGHFSLAG
ncbi:MAG: GGDEF domain-containing protein [Hyphomonas sp.]